MGEHEQRADGDLGLRVSDAERDAVVGVLREQTAAGRLTLEEFEERLDETYRARTAGDLRHVLRELPVQPDPATRRPGVRRAEDRTEEELRARWRRRVRSDLTGFAIPNVVCNVIFVLGDATYWWPGWVLLGTGVAAAAMLAKGFDPDAERAQLAAEERSRAMAEIEMRRALGR